MICSVRKISWRNLFNKLFIVCGAVALIAVASGASGGPWMLEDLKGRVSEDR